MLQIANIARSLFFFLLAGLCEIGGGYLMWLWIRDGRGLWVAVLGAAVLVSLELYRPFSPQILAEFTLLMAAYS